MGRHRNTARQKLRLDIARYLKDFHLSSVLQLLLVVEFWPVFLLRLEEYSENVGRISGFVLRVVMLPLRPLIRGMSGTRISSGAQIGGGLLLHTSVGVVIAAKAVIGENCDLFSGAVVAHKANGQKAGAPMIGDNVKLMTGCKVIGEIRIGDNVVVGANAVVLQDVPDTSIAVGVPAVIKGEVTSDNQA